ncbi:MAG: PepSY-associated TM helix domain-containing protein [Propionibacteriales bacterium]|nr:PepSY-associated TM helix domain-containing protein [Propionibacteriales bacterium]
MVAPRGATRRRGSGQKLTRTLHSWTSMVSLLIVLFFALTGLLANNPQWTFGQQPQVTSVNGQLPDGAIVNGAPNYLVISEYLRTSQGASGQITDYGLSGDNGRISYGSPGYTATATFSVSAGTFTLQTTRSGFVALLTELHKGTNASTPWKLAIDVAAIGLTAVAATGLILQLMMAKKRTTALVLLSIGVVAGVGLMFLA